jgi:hypothetical protein
VKAIASELRRRAGGAKRVRRRCRPAPVRMGKPSPDTGAGDHAFVGGAEPKAAKCWCEVTDGC